jgi:hypothetical protein
MVMGRLFAPLYRRAIKMTLQVLCKRYAPVTSRTTQDFFPRWHCESGIASVPDATFSKNKNAILLGTANAKFH